MKRSYHRICAQLKIIRLISHSHSADKYSRDDDIVLFKTKPSRAKFPRSVLAISSLNSVYWTWYVVDFAPSIQSITGISAAQADNTVGYLGLGLSVFMSLGSMLYPKSLVTEISVRRKNGFDSALVVKTYDLPFVFRSKKTTIYPIGNLVIDSPNDVTKIITQYGGDIAKFPGHLALHAESKYTNLLMNLSKDSVDEVFDRVLLLKYLTPGRVVGQVKIAPLKTDDILKPLNTKTLVKKKKK